MGGLTNLWCIWSALSAFFFISSNRLSSQENYEFIGVPRTVVINKIKRVKGDRNIYLFRCVESKHGENIFWACSIPTDCMRGQKIRRNRKYTLTFGNYGPPGYKGSLPGPAWEGCYIHESQVYIPHPDPDYKRRFLKKKWVRSYPVMYRISDTNGRYLCISDSL